MLVIDKKAMVMDFVVAFEVFMDVIHVMAMVVEVNAHCYWIEACSACDRRDGDGDRHCFTIEAVIHVLDVMAIVMEVLDIVKRI